MLHRTTRRLALTADGVRLYERCARVVAEADEAAEIAAGVSEVPRGTMRVHAPPGLAQFCLTQPIRDFMQSHPSVSVDLRLSDRVPDLTGEQIDVAIVAAGRLADSNLTTRKLAVVRVAACASPQYLRQKGIPFRPQDLVLHNCVSHVIRQTSDDLRFQTDEGAVSMTSLAKLVVDDTRFLREAAIAGLGIVMAPELLVAEDLAKGRLMRVLDDFHTIEIGVHALHPHGRLPPASVRAFIDHLGVCFRESPWNSRSNQPIATPKKKAKAKGPPIPMTEQDVRRLSAVAKLYEEEDAAASAQLRGLLARAKATMASKIPRTALTMNSRARVSDDHGSERELSLAYPWDKGRDRVSVTSALGLELLGASIGTRVRDRERTLTIKSIPYQPEAAGDHHL